MIYLSARRTIVWKNSDGPVKGTRNELPSTRGEVDISDCSHMSLVDGPGPIHLPDVERIAVGVIVAHHQVHWFQRVKTESHCFVGESDLLNWGFSPEVIEDERPVDAGGS